jgi:hypothetical protein
LPANYLVAEPPILSDEIDRQIACSSQDTADHGRNPDELRSQALLVVEAIGVTQTQRRILKERANHDRHRHDASNEEGLHDKSRRAPRRLEHRAGQQERRDP